MNNKSKIGTIESIAFISIVTINKLIMNTSRDIISQSGSSAWINVIYISIIAILFALLLYKLFKNFTSSDIIDVSEYLGGKPLKIITSVLYLSLFIIFVSIILRDFSETLKIIYFNTTPIIFIMGFFIVGIVFANKLGFNVMAKINLIILPFMLISILIILFSEPQFYVTERLTPILGYGAMETFFSGLTNIFAYSGIAYLYFLMPLLDKKTDFKKISVISLILSSIYLFLSVTSLLLTFSLRMIDEELMPIYLITRIIEYGRFFQRIDALFIFLWVLSFLSYLSILTHFVIYSFKKITNIRNETGMLYCFAAIILGISLIPVSIIEVKNFSDIVFKYLVIAIVFIISPIILFLANLKYNKKNKINKIESG